MGDRPSNPPSHPGAGSPLTLAVQVIAFVIAWFVAARLAAYTMTGPDGVLAIWPASGLSVAVLVNQPRRRWTLWLAVIWTANMLQALATGTPWTTAALLSAVDVVEGLLAATLLVRLVGTPVTLGPLREVLALVFGAAILSVALTSLLGAAVMVSWVGGSFGTAWAAWWMANGVGMLLTAPLLLAARGGWRQLKTGGVSGAVEIGLLLVSFAAVCTAVFPPRWTGYAGLLPYVLFPWLMWAALRAGPFFTTVAVCVAAGAAVHSLANGTGQFFAAASTVGGRVLMLQSFVGVVVLSSLLAAAAVVERKRAQATLNRYRLLSEYAADVMFFFRARDLRIVEANAAAAAVYGRSRDDLLAATVTEITAPESRDTIAARVDEAGRRPLQYESVHQNRDGTLIPVEVSLRGMEMDGDPVLLAIVRDLRERHRLEFELRQAQKMEAVGRLAGGIAHDFNNLLQVISGFASLALEDVPDSSPARGSLEEVTKATGKAADLTRRLLAFSRKQVLAPVVLDLNGVIADLEAMLRRLIGEHIELTTVLAAGVGRVKADPNQIEQAVINLVVNARDAMPHGGQLSISTGVTEIVDGSEARPSDLRPGRYAVVEVRDTGIGIAEELKGRVFEPFFTTKGRDKGTGLGLSTVYGGVRQSGGHVSFTSTPGVGTIFRILLPMVPDPIPEPGHATSTGVVRRGSGVVLLVEDEVAVRALTRAMLERQGFTVLEAAGGEAAVELARTANQPIRLLLTDVIMPGMSGPEVAAAIGRTRPGIRFLYMSGYTDDAVSHHGVLVEGTSLLQKPFTSKELASKVWDVLDAP
jgi:two-component system, cell cycle sensor histidine kinase and response regulator CckA